MNRTIISRGLILALLAAVFGSLVWIWAAGPVVIVQVATTDVDGVVAPAVGDTVCLWTNDGLVESSTDTDGKASFWFIRHRARWVPSLGPGSYPWRSTFSIQTRPSVREGRGCNSILDERRIDFAMWFWQRENITRPTYGQLSVNLDGISTKPRRDVVKIEATGMYYVVPTSHVESVCLRSDRVYTVSLVVDSITLQVWSDVVVSPRGTITLRIPAERRHDS